MDGILLVKKPRGVTSSDIVIKLRKILQTKKIGHTGTLDPLAEGLLVIVVGKATKVSDILINHTKEYIATMKIGVQTTTYDEEGEIINTSKNNLPLNYEKIILSYNKTYMQEVPLYSSVKVKGKKLYEYARNNEEVILPKKEVTVSNLEILKKEDNEITFKCKVSKGTYIRSLINDIGKDLKTYAIMTKLIRTKVNDFTLEKSHSIEEIKNNKYQLIPIEEGLNIPKIIVDEETEKNISHGKKILNIYQIKDKAIFINKKNKLLGIYEKEKEYLKVWKNFI